MGGFDSLEDNQHQEEQRRRYLLGTLPADERMEIEESYLSDDEVFEVMESLETELVDAYVRNALPASERLQVRKKLLTSPRLLEKAKFATALAQSLAKPPNRPRFWERIFGRFFSISSNGLKVALASCALLLIAFGALLLVQRSRLREQSSYLVSEREARRSEKTELERKLSEEQLRTAQLNAELKNAKEQKLPIEKIQPLEKQPGESPTQVTSPTFASITLFPGSQRGGTSNRNLVVKPGTPAIKLTLGLDANDYLTYRAIIKNQRGSTVVQFGGLHPNADGSITLTLSARVLPPGEYSVVLLGKNLGPTLEDAGTYRFKVLTHDPGLNLPSQTPTPAAPQKP
jgi:hypothetical protein